jgi:hypothetical protein
MSLDFDPLVWDLNPEGVGVQPMIANVTISFAFIGGSSLEGPINKLQNAVSYNFFANTEIYDARADRIKIKEGLQANDEGKGYGELVPGEKVNSPKTPLEEPQNKVGLSNNTNDSTNNQEVEANNEANKTENTQVDSSNDISLLTMLNANIQNEGDINTPTNVVIRIGKNEQEELSQDYKVTNIKLQDTIGSSNYNIPVNSTFVKDSSEVIIDGTEGVSALGLIANKPYIVFVDLIGSSNNDKITVRKLVTWQ